MGEIYQKYPDDTEAAIFYALALKSTADKTDRTYANQKKAGAILESIFPDQPNHPGIAHYIIHNYDNPELAGLALPTARRYAEIAPASAHAQHMPSHIFTRLGLWEESISSNLNSAGSAVCYAEAVNMEGHWDQEIHAIDYLVYAYLQQGDNAKAEEQFVYLNNMDGVASISTIAAYPLVAIPARLALENKKWSDAENLELTSHVFPWEEHSWEIAMLHFTRALGASHTGNVTVANEEIATLNALQKSLSESGDNYSANQVMIQMKSAQAWLEFSQGNHDVAIALMQEASDMESATAKHPVTPGEVLPASELLGDMYLAMDKPAEALKAYQLDLRDHPNRFNGIYGAAVASDMLDDEEGARKYYSQLIAMTKSSGSERPEVVEARKFIG
jgi:tetratricopeptide (TPR) repeat protein